jgi:taurine dioxygenase
MDILPMAGALGAEVKGVDLRAEISNSTAADIHAAFLRHHMLYFPDQHLSPQQELRFARIFGEPDIYPFIKGLPDTPEVIEILKTETDSRNFGGSWHSDTTYMDEPALGSVLLALEVPDCGGDTLFANMALAYDALSDGLKRTLDGLVGVNSSEGPYSSGRAAAMASLNGMKGAYKTEATVYESQHPVVRTHPESGLKALYVNLSHTRRFAGWTEAESRPLLDFLCDHAVRPEFTCRLRWQAGGIAVWDNRCTQHFALNDYQGKRRRMHRVTIKGDRPR